MALQDLTPQLRTRLSRMERAVGWFVLLAVGLLLFGFGYYLYNTAERKGWFQTKAPYYTYTASASGLKVGDPVTLMGLGIGQITRMEPMKPSDWEHNMYVEFEIRSPYFGYIWTEGSKAQVASAGLLGNRSLEVTKGTGGYATYVFNPLSVFTPAAAQSVAGSTNWVLGQEVFQPGTTNLIARPLQRLSNFPAIANAGFSNLVLLDKSVEQKVMTGIWSPYTHRYEPFKKGALYELPAVEAPPVSEQLQSMIAQVERVLPNVFNLTNYLQEVLTNSAELTSNLNVVALSARPAVSNLTAALSQLNRPGALGEWLLSPNARRELEGLLDNANGALTNANTNLFVLASNLNVSLDNLAGMTGNLRDQVAANPTLVRGIADAVVHADQLVQGLKRHWLFRNLFPAPTSPKATNQPPQTPLSSPKAATTP
jgi:ABC-type transporter Mla subunit MlaD